MIRDPKGVFRHPSAKVAFAGATTEFKLRPKDSPPPPKFFTRKSTSIFGSFGAKRSQSSGLLQPAKGGTKTFAPGVSTGNQSESSKLLRMLHDINAQSYQQNQTNFFPKPTIREIESCMLRSSGLEGVFRSRDDHLRVTLPWRHKAGRYESGLHKSTLSFSRVRVNSVNARRMSATVKKSDKLLNVFSIKSRKDSGPLLAPENEPKILLKSELVSPSKYLSFQGKENGRQNSKLSLFLSVG